VVNFLEGSIMQASTRLSVFSCVALSLWLTGCSSKPTGAQPSTGTPSPTQSDTTVATPSPDSPSDSPTAAEVGGRKKTDDRVGSKVAPPIIGQLKSRHHLTLIHTSSDGPRFTVSTHDGKVVAAALTLDEIQSQLPEIYKLYKDTFATRGGTIDSGSYLDAGSPPLHAPTTGR
jgi:hypothetical protein